MILSTHALTGAVIGKNFQNLWVIIILSLVIHFIMDSFRHGEYLDSRTATIKNTFWKIFLDLSTSGAIIFGFLLFYKPDFLVTRNILLGSFFSMFPDLLTVLFWKFKWSILGKVINFHTFCHRYSKFPHFSPERQWTLRNATNDIILSLISIILIFLS